MIPPVHVDDWPSTREMILKEASTPEALAAVGGVPRADGPRSATPSGRLLQGVTIHTEPSPLADGNPINIQFIRPDTDEVLACVYYIHGGGMTMMSCYDGMYRAWGRIIAAKGVAVAMVDFRNAMRASSAPEVAPFPAGLNDCVSGLKWVHDNAGTLGIDPARIVVAGESGGGNLTLATGLKLSGTATSA